MISPSPSTWFLKQKNNASDAFMGALSPSHLKAFFKINMNLILSHNEKIL